LRRSDEGFVLVVVLWVLAIMSVVTLSFWHQARLESRAAALTVDRVQAEYMARGAVYRGIAELVNKNSYDRVSDRPIHTSYNQRWRSHEPMLEEAPYYSVAEDEAFENDMVDYQIEDTMAKMSLNFAPEIFLQEQDDLSRRMVSEIMRRREEMADEGSDRAFLTLGDALQLESIKEEDWDGSRNDGASGLRDRLTVWGGTQINVNTASREVLMSFPNVDPSVVDALLDYRVGNDGVEGTEDDRAFMRTGELTNKLGLEGTDAAPLTRFGTILSTVYSVRGEATQRQGTVRAHAEAVVEMANEEVVILHWREGTFGS
jgi:hypothetical protein